MTKHASWEERASWSSSTGTPRGVTMQSVPRESDGVST